MDHPPLRVLVASYIFPPIGGAGVQRLVKLVKYLPAHGLLPTVLSVKNPSVPVIDRSHERDVPPSVPVLRTRTLEPGYGLKQVAWQAKAAAHPGLLKRVERHLTQIAKQLLIPDPQVLWLPTAQAVLLGRLLRGHDDVVFLSGPPFSQFLLAPLSRLRPGVAVVLDYRDEWSTYRSGSAYEMMGSRLAAAMGDPLERAILRLAHVVTTATEEFREGLLRRFPFLRPERVHTIPNGYDPDDFPADLPAPPADRFVLTYAGTIFRLTSARGLLGAIRRLHAAEPELARLLDVRFIGRVVDTELDAFEGTEALGVRRLGYLDHHEVIRQLAASHLVLCLLDEVEGVERIYPGKIFELMYLGRPCLVLSPPGALTRLARRHQLGHVLPPRDEAAIAALLAERLRAFRDGGGAGVTRAAAPGPVDIGDYHRRVLAGRFAGAMGQAVSLARAPLFG